MNKEELEDKFVEGMRKVWNWLMILQGSPTLKEPKHK